MNTRANVVYTFVATSDGNLLIGPLLISFKSINITNDLPGKVHLMYAERNYQDSASTKFTYLKYTKLVVVCKKNMDKNYIKTTTVCESQEFVISYILGNHFNHYAIRAVIFVSV